MEQGPARVEDGRVDGGGGWKDFSNLASKNSNKRSAKTKGEGEKEKPETGMEGRST